MTAEKPTQMIKKWSLTDIAPHLWMDEYPEKSKRPLTPPPLLFRNFSLRIIQQKQKFMSARFDSVSRSNIASM